MSELFKIALRNVGRNRQRSLLTGITVTLGVIALLFSRAYIDGLQELMYELVIEMRDGALEVQPAGYFAAREVAPLTMHLPSDGPLADGIRAVPGIRAVSPRLRFTGLLSRGDSTSAFLGIGVDPQTDREVCPRGPAAGPRRDGAFAGLIAGEGFQRRDEATVVVAQGLAEALGIRLHDPVTLIAETVGGSTNAVDLTVSGIYTFPDPGENKHSLVVPLTIAQTLLRMPGKATGLAIAVHERTQIPAIAAKLRALLQDSAAEVHTWDDLAPYYRDVMTLQEQVLRLVVFVVFALVVANVVNAMLMAVFERTREIGTLMSIGFRRRRILSLFLLESVVLSTIAATVGVGLGIALVAFAHRHGLPINVPAVGVLLNRPIFAPSYIPIGVLGAIAGGAVGGLLPALRASRLKPVEALRS